MKKPKVLIDLLKLIIAVNLGWILWLFIFAAIIPEEQEISDFQSLVSLLLGLGTGTLLLMGIKYNSAHGLGQTARRAFSDIKVMEEKSQKLMDKANRVADKYMKQEKKIYTGLEKIRSTDKKTKIIIRNGSDFYQAVQQFPELRSNENIKILIKQIQECETGITRQKIIYNSSVEDYNAAIHSFPFSMIRRLCKFEEMEYYDGTMDQEVISDEALGI